MPEEGVSAKARNVKDRRRRVKSWKKKKKKGRVEGRTYESDVAGGEKRRGSVVLSVKKCV